MSTTTKPKTAKSHAPVHASAPKEASAAPAAPAPIPEAIAAPSSPVLSLAPLARGGTLAARIETLLAQLEILPTLLGTEDSPATARTIAQRRNLPRMKTGAEPKVPGILALADQYKLVLPGGGTKEAREDLKLIETLVLLEAKLATATSLVGDVIGQAKGRTWETTTMGYAMLARLVKRFPALQVELEPMASFLATKHKSAPTILRQAEAKTLSKSRAKRKATEESNAAPIAQSAAVAPTSAAPPSPASPVAHAPIAAAPAAVAPAPTSAGN